MKTKGKLTLKHVMTKKVDVVSPDTTLGEIIHLLHKRKGLPVVNENRQLLGILKEYNLLKIEKTPENLKIKVSEVMEPDPFTLFDSASFSDAERAFLIQRKNPIPVVDSQLRVVGIVSRSDILRPLNFSFWIKKGFFTYFNFLKKSIFSSPDDIERPYHKIINLFLKIIGISFIIIGLSLNWFAARKYITEYRPTVAYYQQANRPDSVSLQNQQISRQQIDDLFREIFFLSLFGVASLMLSASLATILLLRYVAFTLPDRIYFRAFATENERRRKRLPTIND